MSSPPIHTAPPLIRSTPSTSNVDRIKSLLRSTLRVSVIDGRIFLGTFAGTDKLLNILLVNADEFRVGQNGIDGRYVGQILIPWSLVVRIESRLVPEQGRYGDSDEGSMYT